KTRKSRPDRDHAKAGRPRKCPPKGKSHLDPKNRLINTDTLAQDTPLVWPRRTRPHIIVGSDFALMRPGRGRFSLAPRRQLTEALPGLHEDRGFAACPLVAADNHIDVKRVELESAADAAGLVGRDEGRTGAEERVDDDVAALGEVGEGVLEHGGRFDGRMVLEAASGVG